MGIEDTIAWYQKKIGTYDKQPWEKSVEQRILPGLSHIELKKGKPKTELIDLDLVRGSSFTKAKPKHGFIKVTRLSVLRVIFLPICSKWWVQQTSGKIFGILLLVYLLQLYNVATYTCNTAHLQDDESHSVPRSEIIVPIIMMLMLCFIHSQIEATNPLGAKKIERKYSCKSYRRVRRHRKVTVDKAEGSDGAKKPPAGKESLNQADKSNKNVLFEENDVIIPNEEVKEEDEQNNLDIAIENRRPNRLPFDDDGFESLNGNGSSPSDNGEERVVPSKASLNGIRCHEWVKEVRDTRKMPFLTRRQSVPNLRFSSGELESDSDTSIDFEKERRNSQIPLLNKKTQVESVCESDDEHEIDNLSAQETVASGQIDASASGTEWMAVTTNSEDCSYSSELSEADTHFDNIEADAPPTSILRYSDRVSCTIWKRREIKKADLSVFDISSMIIARVEQMPESMNYFYIGLFTSTTLAILPILCRFCYTAIDSSNLDELQLSLFEITQLVFGTFSLTTGKILEAMLGNKTWERSVMVIAAFQRLVLGFLLFFLLTIAERTFKQRFLYAKLFSHLTSSRRAKKSDLPHFRLNKVRNIKTWLSVRSYLKKRGPQRSVDVIVSAAFIVTLLLLSFLCMELLKESFVLNSQYNLEIMIWSIGLGIMILRFMTLGVKINKKYRNLSILITEQINLYLQIEQKPHKKDELMVANNVLKLAADLLKELESQFKILGLCANPFLYNITKVVILSALSGVLSEILGFKLKLHKIKIK